MTVTVELEVRDAVRLLEVVSKLAMHDSMGIWLAGELRWIGILDALHEALERRTDDADTPA